METTLQLSSSNIMVAHFPPAIEQRWKLKQQINLATLFGSHDLIDLMRCLCKLNFLAFNGQNEKPLLVSFLNQALNG